MALTCGPASRASPAHSPPGLPPPLAPPRPLRLAPPRPPAPSTRWRTPSADLEVLDNLLEPPCPILSPQAPS